MDPKGYDQAVAVRADDAYGTTDAQLVREVGAARKRIDSPDSGSGRRMRPGGWINSTGLDFGLIVPATCGPVKGLVFTV
jgi:hypothetical protein